MSSVGAFISLGRQVNKLTLNQWTLLYPYVHVRSRLNLQKACSYRINAGNALRTIRTSISLPWKSQEVVDRGRVLTVPGFVRRSYSSDNNGRKETEVVKQSPTKKQLKSEDLFRILSLAKPEYKSLAGAIGLLFISSAVTMSVPFCMGKIIDIIYTSSQDTSQMVETLSYVCKILCGVFLLGGAANFGRVYLIQVSGQKVVKRLRDQLFSAILRQETAFFDKTRTGELINRLSADTILVGKAVTDNVSDGLRAVAQSVAGVSMMFYFHPSWLVLSLVLCHQ